MLQYIHKQMKAQLQQDKWRESPKAVASYTPALVIVHLCKPAHSCEGAFTYKTGGCNNDAGCSGKNFCSSARKGNASERKVTGGADFTTKPNRLVGMRKGSVFVRGVATEGFDTV